MGPNPSPKEPTLTCLVCGTANPATRQFCRKCASDLRAPVPSPGVSPAPLPEPSPIRPIIAGGGLALLAVIVLAGVVILLTGGPSPSPSPTLAPVASPTAAPPAATPSPTEPPITPAATAAATAAATPVASPRPPRIRSFVAPDAVPCGAPSHSGFITVSWEIRNATGVTISIDGPGIYEEYEGLTGRVDLPFTCSQSHTYLLTTVGGVGPPATREVVVEPQIDSPSPTGF